MSKKFVNNKFNGAINGKRCKDYYKESNKYGSDVQFSASEQTFHMIPFFF